MAASETRESEGATVEGQGKPQEKAINIDRLCYSTLLGMEDPVAHVINVSVVRGKKDEEEGDNHIFTYLESEGVRAVEVDG
ncbi:MAG: hypothetical protein ACP5VF_13620, partial [Acidobacteriota bacterium]